MRTTQWARLVAATAALTLVTAGCGGGDDAPDADAQPTAAASTPAQPLGDISVAALDFGFTGIPAVVPAGKVTFTLVNQGKEKHMLAMAKLTKDAPPVAELVKLKGNKADKFLAKELGVIPPVKPGETGKKKIKANLTAGTYGYVCFVYSKQKKKPHALLGMFGEFSVL